MTRRCNYRTLNVNAFSSIYYYSSTSMCDVDGKSFEFICNSIQLKGYGIEWVVTTDNGSPSD